MQKNPQQPRHSARWLGLLLMLLPVMAWSAAAQLDQISVKQKDGRTRVYFDLSSSVTPRIFSLDSPPRLVIDLPDTVTDVKRVSAKDGGGLIKHVRTGVRNRTDLRVVLDLTEDGIRAKGYAQPPQSDGDTPRIIVDLFKDGEVVKPPATDQKPLDEPKPVTSTDKPAQKAAEPKPVKPPANQPKRKVVIVIDPGHGGHDPGAIGPTGVLEKNVVLAISKKLAAMVNEQPSMRAVLTRSDDTYLSLRQRLDKARKAGADLFVSIHANSSTSPKPNGVAVFALSLGGATSEHARLLAARENVALDIGGINLGSKDKIVAAFMLDLAQSATIEASLDLGERVLQSIASYTTLIRKEVEQAAFVVLKSPDIPSLLIETGFISNPREEVQLNSASYQSHIAQATLQGIKGYFDSYRAGSISSGSQEHQVKAGENLSTIAQNYHVSLQRLRDYNNLKTDQLQKGQKLRIPPPKQ